MQPADPGAAAIREPRHGMRRVLLIERHGLVEDRLALIDEGREFVEVLVHS
jgi:hypothetical protein